MAMPKTPEGMLEKATHLGKTTTLKLQQQISKLVPFISIQHSEWQCVIK